MNTLSFGDFKDKALHRLRLGARILDPIRLATTFSKKNAPDALQRIYVINLDRKPKRWNQLRRELDRFRARGGEHLSTLARRFSAVDARYVELPADPAILKPTYTLTEQLMVHPNPLLKIDAETSALEIEMSRQEVAVALSHVSVWRLIAEGDVPSALVLEDDVMFGPGFVRGLVSTWSSLVTADGTYSFDLLYLDYRDVGETKPARTKQPQRRSTPGLWEAAGYVLTKEGAQRLLDKLPINGPVDLWLNFQFDDLRVFSSARPLIEQRANEPSTNSYSVLPVLSKVGAITQEKQVLPSGKRLPGPIMGIGPAGSGLTALATALSMIGYTCASDLNTFPAQDLEALRTGRGRCRFNAFVNVGDLDQDAILEISQHNRRLRWIVTGDFEASHALPSERVLHLPASGSDRWAALSDFLNIDYPAFDYPADPDRTQRRLRKDLSPRPQHLTTRLRTDRSPWIQPFDHSWSGTDFDSSVELDERLVSWTIGKHLDQRAWYLRDDTFPSNLALFHGDNVVLEKDAPIALVLSTSTSPVRDYSSGAIASRNSFLYGSFAATLQPSNASGTITGLFLHRNGPRQEIDIEILGKDTTKMLANVYFNPGPIGTKLEYGYRGTPIEIELGFDASAAPHKYEIVWTPDFIEWKVDGTTVHRRNDWDPTPIPNQPLELNINLWTSRSVEFAGSFDMKCLPIASTIHRIDVASVHPTEVATSQKTCTDAVVEPSLQG